MTTTTTTTTNTENYTEFIGILNELATLTETIPTLRAELEDAPTCYVNEGHELGYRNRCDEFTADELDEAIDRYNELIGVLETDERFGEDGLGLELVTMGDRYFDLQDKLTRD